MEQRPVAGLYPASSPIEDIRSGLDAAGSSTGRARHRRAATGHGAGTDGAEGREERCFDVVERHEEAVVGKQVCAVEEIVIRKDAKKRVATVRDIIRERRSTSATPSRAISPLGRRAATTATNVPMLMEVLAASLTPALLHPSRAWTSQTGQGPAASRARAPST
jgi:hypothetical protein